MPDKTYIPAVKVKLAGSSAAAKADALGMREMQARAYRQRGAQYLLIKSPPASGKSRALMFIALDKLHRQGLRKAVICVPERAIGSSFADNKLTEQGFYWDWHIAPQWNLCDTEGSDSSRSKVKAAADFLAAAGAEDKILLCTHATFRFAYEKIGAEAFDACLIAIDEFHHVSGDRENNILGRQLSELTARGKAHITAMTGSYFRGDSAPVLLPEDEEKFVPVSYTYYEQLKGYHYLKQLELGYYFYQGRYLDSIAAVLDAGQKTIIHIPHVAARESTREKLKEAEEIMNALGEYQGEDPATGFSLIRRPSGKILRVADLVDDEPKRRNRVLAALKDPKQAENKDHVDIIIALGMAKEGFDWIWCEHALTVGYRSSLTEIVQIIGRATRDAPGKTKARFTNLIAEPDASEDSVKQAINDTLKAIAASLLMEQVLAPKFEFAPKRPPQEAKPQDGFDYGEGGYNPEGGNVGYNPQTDTIQIEINGLAEPKSAEAQRICREDLQEIVAAALQNEELLKRGLFDAENTIPEELNILGLGKIIAKKYPNETEEDREAIRQRAVAQLGLLQAAKENAPQSGGGETLPSNMQLIEGARKFLTNVRALNIDLIDRINPFGAAYSILSKAMNETALKEIQAIVAAGKIKLTREEARDLAKKALQFKENTGRLPDLNSGNEWERLMAKGIAWLQNNRDKAQ